ncbi:MAG: hypothetical protein AAGB01_00880 [Cyanobacteria bacterium P01_F01_bin.42]
MLSSCADLSIGDWVALNADGARAHRDFYRTTFLVGGIAMGTILLPIALPGAFLATIGIANGGGEVLSPLTNYLENHPEAQAVGVIRQKNERWWGQDGYDYEVVWSNAEPFGESSWHLDWHLNRIKPPQDLVEINL